MKVHIYLVDFMLTPCVSNANFTKSAKNGIQ